MFIGNISLRSDQYRRWDSCHATGDLDRGYPSIHHLYTPVHATDHSDGEHREHRPIDVAAAERVFELLDEEEEIKEVTTHRLTRAEGAVAFEHVDFGYGTDLLIEDMNIDVAPGQTVAIVGPTGAGKTTMINLLSAFMS